MEKIGTFIVTVLMTILSILVVYPIISPTQFTEGATLQDTYAIGMFLGGVVVLLWIVVLYIWKD